MTTRSPGLSRQLVLPNPPEKYDAQDQREIRRILVDASRQATAFGSVISIPAPVDALGSLVGAADTVPYFTSATAMSLAALTAFARTLLADSNAGAARATLGAVLQRSSVAFTTASLANLASELGSVPIPATVVSLLTIQASASCWVRLYASAATQAADAARAFGTAPTAGKGVLAEFDFSAIGTIPCSPVPLLSNDEGPPTATLYYTVQNRSGGAAALTILLEVLPAEL